MEKTITILFIDDSSSDRILFHHILREIDPTINYITANSGQDALDLLSAVAKLPDYIFLDINMPGMDGIECLQQIRKQERFAHIPVFMYSTGDAHKYEETAKHLGATQYLTKNTDFVKSVEQIASLLIHDEKEK